MTAAIQHLQLEFGVTGGHGFADGQGYKSILTAPDQKHG